MTKKMKHDGGTDQIVDCKRRPQTRQQNPQGSGTFDATQTGFVEKMVTKLRDQTVENNDLMAVIFRRNEKYDDTDGGLTKDGGDDGEDVGSDENMEEAIQKQDRIGDETAKRRMELSLLESDHDKS